MRPCCLLPLQAIWWLSLNASRKGSEKQILSPGVRMLLVLGAGRWHEGLRLVWPLVQCWPLV